ncbi:MAG: hypothetical protein M3R49_03985 [Chloroflexota bacterium]|nr:hypothetical protein [Chloroflexota bacterium]
MIGTISHGARLPTPKPHYRFGVALIFILPTVLAMATFAAPSRVSAAGIGEWAPATVQCDNFLNTLTLTPRAGAADLTSTKPNAIYYHYWIRNNSTGAWVAGWNPTGWGTIVHTPVSMVAAPPFGYVQTGSTSTTGYAHTVGLPNGNYSVYTEYAWPNATGWLYAGGWSNRYRMWSYLNGWPTSSSCTI